MDTALHCVEKEKGLIPKATWHREGVDRLQTCVCLCVSKVESWNESWVEGLKYLADWQLVCHFKQKPWFNATNLKVLSDLI